MTGRLAVGSIVRAPLRGRRIRGWVVEVGPGIIQDLKPIAAMSGKTRVFDDALLETARGLARTYIQPLSSYLSLFTPDRLGRPSKKTIGVQQNSPHPEGPRDWVSVKQLSLVSRASSAYEELIQGALARGDGVILIVPEVSEGSTVIEDIVGAFPDSVAVVHSGLDPAQRSKALWEIAAGEKRIAIGGRAAAFVPPMGSTLTIVHAEHDGSLKDQRSPYYDAREVAIERTHRTGGRVVLASKSPSVWALGNAMTRGWQLDVAPRQQTRSVWPIVEVVEPPRTGLPRRGIAALLEAKKLGKRSIVLLPRARSTRAGPGPEQVVKAIARVVPQAKIARADRTGLGSDPGHLRQALMADVVVATSAAISDVPRPTFHTCLLLGIDSYLQMPSGRAVEDAFTQIFEAATWVIDLRSKGRLLLETTEPEHRLVQAVTRGDPAFFARHELDVRKGSMSPPFVTMVRLTFKAQPSDELTSALRELPGCLVLGPVPSERGMELMLNIADRRPGLDALGTIIRQSAERALVEVDPRDW